MAVGDEAPHDLTVLLPKSDYDRDLLKSRLEAAGVLLLLTVLAFNLVGDGLRDAFDPKMKR